MKTHVKEKFDYEIPIAAVQKAGISTTGAEIENELIPLANEITPYRIVNRLWKVPMKSVAYQRDGAGNVFRIRMVDNTSSEPETFYSIKK